jgi:hypothetical protein
MAGAERYVDGGGGGFSGIVGFAAPGRFRANQKARPDLRLTRSITEQAGEATVVREHKNDGSGGGRSSATEGRWQRRARRKESVSGRTRVLQRMAE